MMIPIETIKIFTYKGSDEDDRYPIQKPFEWRENICATNGHILIVVPKVLVTDLDKLGSFVNSHPPDLDKVIIPPSNPTKSKDVNLKDLIALFKKVEWKTTNTERRTELGECPTCGHGEASIEVDVRIRKKVSFSSFEFDGFAINAKLLLMLVNLFKNYPANWEYYIAQSDSPGGHTFRFNNKNGVEVLIMGVRG